MPIYETLGHIPLMIAAPGVTPGTNDALTTSVDIFATLAALFGVEPRQRTHGKSLLPLLSGKAQSVRDWLLAGVWGREVHYIDGKIKYARAPSGNNRPLGAWSNRWSTMPTHVLAREQEMPLPDERAPPRPDAGQQGARDPPNLGRERSGAVLGDGAVLRQPSLRPAPGIRTRRTISPAPGSSATWSPCCARR